MAYNGDVSYKMTLMRNLADITTIESDGTAKNKAKLKRIVYLYQIIIKKDIKDSYNYKNTFVNYNQCVLKPKQSYIFLHPLSFFKKGEIISPRSIFSLCLG